VRRPAGIGEAAAVFHGLIRAHGLRVEELTARSAWRVFGEYGRMAFDTPDLPDADGLLYQYGMYRPRGRSLFELDLVRQFEVVNPGASMTAMCSCTARCGMRPRRDWRR
jgi:hypothetical protein